MAYTTFAAIDVGSYEIGMKIFELSKNRGMREIDSIRHRLELGRRHTPQAKSAWRRWRISASCSCLTKQLWRGTRWMTTGPAPPVL